MSAESEIFTPGPWHVSPGAPGESHGIMAGRDRIAFVLPLGPRQEVRGNARLMAQAPQMRAALLKALAYLTPEQAEDCGIAAALGRVEPAPPPRS